MLWLLQARLTFSPKFRLECMCVRVLRCMHLANHAQSLPRLDSTKPFACRSFVLFQLGAAHAVSAANFFMQQVCKGLLSVIEWGRV